MKFHIHLYSAKEFKLEILRLYLQLLERGQEPS